MIAKEKVPSAGSPTGTKSERYHPAGREVVTIEQQLRFIRMLRAFWAREGIGGGGVAMLGEVIASLDGSVV
jgi:hypothetical protein